MKNYKRASRRFHTQRVYRKRKKMWIAQMLIEDGISDENLQKHLKNPVPCTCWMCGNPRKYQKERTLQELKAEEKFKSDWNDLVA
jgi:hypothetical protein